MGTIGVKYKDSSTGLDISKILMNAIAPDPDAAANRAKTEAYLMGAQLDRQRTQGLIALEAEKAARDRQAFDEQTTAAGAATDYIYDNMGRARPRVPIEAPVVVEPGLGLVKTPEQQAEEAFAYAQPSPTTLSVDPGQDPTIAHLLPAELQPPTWPAVGEPPVPVELNGGPLPQTYDQLAPGLDLSAARIADPSQVVNTPEVSSWFNDPDTAPVPIDDYSAAAAATVPTVATPATRQPRPFPTGPAVDNGDDTITTQSPEGVRKVMSKSEIQKLAIVAMRSNDPAGQMQKLAGQLGLTYSDDPKDLEKAMILLGQDARHLPTDLGGEGGETKQSDIKGMRGEVTKAREMLSTVEPLYKSLETSLDRTDHVSDLDFVYGIATILDPGSVVRETDAVNIARSAGLSPEILGRINAVNGGAALDKPTRLKLMALAQARIGGYRDVFDKTARDYVERAKRNKWNPLDVVSQEDLDRLANPQPVVVPGAPPSGWTQAKWDRLTAAEQQEILDERAGRPAGGTP
jgi:hypothetical protein